MDGACPQTRTPYPALPECTSAGLTPIKHGFCALLLSPDCRLPQVPLGSERVLYIGGLHEPGVADVHLDDGDSSRSCFRRSLGALLRHELKLQVRPRTPGRSSQDWTHYRFNTEGEKRLTHWLRTHVCVVHPDDASPKRTLALEPASIDRLDPPLNLDGPPTPFRRLLMELQAACREDARAWALERQ